MKNTGLFIIILLLSAFSLQAQTPPPPQYSLSVNKSSISDNVTIKVESATMNSTNTYPIFIGFNEPTTVTLTAINYEYYDGAKDVFVKWEGDLTGNTNPVTLLVDGQKVITAIYMHGDPAPTTQPTPVPPPVLGDVNGDEAIDIIDALLTAQYYVGLNPSGFILSNADVNCDGSVDIIDALLIAQYYVGSITGFC